MIHESEIVASLAKRFGVSVEDVEPRFKTLRENGMPVLDAVHEVENELRRLGIPEREEKGLPESTPLGGVNVDEFIETARKETGEWITTSEAHEGDEFEILGPGEVDDETFDRPYLCIPVRYNDQERRLRLGVQNVERIRKKLGGNTADWIGKRIRVTVLELVKGLTKQRGIETKRMILDGV